MSVAIKDVMKKSLLVMAVTGAIVSPVANATTGYFTHGYGTEEKGLAPAVIEDHITVGWTMRIGVDQELNLAGMYAPETSVKGANPFDGARANRNRDVSMGDAGRVGLEILS